MGGQLITIITMTTCGIFSRSRLWRLISKVKVPVIGFKVLAAGAIPPEDGFRYAFESGADFICVGMFDYQVVEDVNIVTEILNGGMNRSRPWYS